jgi:protein gp37
MRLGTHEKYVHAAPIDVYLDERTLLLPLRWKKPRKIFTCSMTDLFGEFVPDEFIGKVFGVIAEAHRHTFQILTKRAKRMLEWSRTVLHYPKGDRSFRPAPGWPPNAWLGVSVENQAAAAERIPLLLQTPAAVRFLSVEPILEVIDLEPYLWGTVANTAGYFDRNGKEHYRGAGGWTICAGPRNAIHWVIVGVRAAPIGASATRHGLVPTSSNARLPAYPFS